jgi:hypothetical protein
MASEVPLVVDGFSEYIESKELFAFNQSAVTGLDSRVGL